MKLTLATALCCLLVLAANAGAQPGGPRILSLNEYLSELDQLAHAVDRLDERQPSQSGGLLSLPRAWTVSHDGHTFEIKTDWIRRSIADWRLKPGAEARTELAMRLRAIRADAANYAARSAGAATERARLAEILTASEFKDLHGPSWFDTMRQRAMAWLLRLLTTTLGSSAIPAITNVLVYGAIALVVVLIALWMVRSVRHSARLDSIRPDRIPTAARPWTAWLEDARAAAERGEWPDAIHLAYWCGISFLETQDAWRPDRSRTPREYLRVMAATHEHRPALQAMTRELEHVWYGTGQADASTFDEVLAQLKKLGCPSV